MQCNRNIRLKIKRIVVRVSVHVYMVLCYAVVVCWLWMQFGWCTLHGLVVPASHLSRPSGGVRRVAGPLASYEEPDWRAAV